MDMHEEIKILIVDDDEAILELLTDFFASEYSIVAVKNGKDAIDAFSKNSFALVLLDVDMSDMDGYEVCRRIKESDVDAKTPVLFLSGKREVEDIVKGYDSGGTDYITKPVEFEVLYKRVKREIDNRRKCLEFEENLNSVTNAMLDVQGDNSKIYATARFLQKSFSCRDTKALCDNLFSVTKSFGTRATLYIHTAHNNFFISDSGVEHDLSNRVLEALKNERRIYEFGNNRAVFNWKSASLLVDNLQNDVDTLAFLMDGFESGIHTIEGVEKFHDILDEYRQQSHLLNINVANVVENLVAKTHEALAKIGATSMLTVDQEDLLKKIADDHLDEVDELFKVNLKTDEQFSHAISTLRSVSASSLDIIEDDGVAFF